MAQFYGYGNRLLTENDFLSSSDDELKKLAAPRPRARAAAAGKSVTPASPIGIGKPLSVEIAYVYTGLLSKKTWNRPDFLLCSAVKKVPVYESAPRAMQAMLESVDEKYGFGSLPATVPGTPLVYHTPSLTDRAITVTLEMVFDRFPAEAFDQVGNMLSNAAGIPVFAPAGGFLFAGSLIVKMFAKAAEKIIDGKPAFAESLSVNSDRPWYENTAPSFMLLTPSHSLGSDFNLKYHADVEQGLLDANGQAYAGPDPYVILTLDGTPRPDYASFTPTMATASLLDRFLHTGDGQPTTTGLILDALRAYNDVYYRSQAIALKKRLETLAEGSEEAKKLKTLIDACLQNIGDDALKPK